MRYKESSSGKCYNNFNNYCISGPTKVSKDTLDEQLQSSLNSKGKQSSNRTRFSTTPSGGKKNITASDLGSFREKVLAEGLSEKVVSLISDTGRSGTINHYESS